jgi:hypothetical protein
MSYPDFPYCRRLFNKTFKQNINRSVSTYSCTYYWKNNHLVRPFLRGISDTAYGNWFNTKPSDIDPRNLTGTNMTKEEFFKSNTKNNTFGNFPYVFSPNNVCQHCPTRDSNPNKPYDY